MAKSKKEKIAKPKSADKAPEKQADDFFVSAGEPKSKAEKPRREPKPEAEKLYLVTRFSAVKNAKGADKLLDESNGSQKAQIYRAIAAAGNPTFKEIFDALDGRTYHTESKSETNACGRWYINRLKKDGLIEAAETREPREGK